MRQQVHFGAIHPRELSQEVSEDETNDPSAEDGSDESFPRLLWRELNQWSAPARESPNESEDVVDNHQSAREEEPDQTFEDVGDVEAGLENNRRQSGESPSQLHELNLVHPLSKTQHESDEAEGKQPEGDHRVMSGKVLENGMREEEGVESCGDGSSIEEVRCAEEEIPVQSSHDGDDIRVPDLGGLELQQSHIPDLL